MNTIMRLTLLEMLKKKILYLTILLTILFLGLYGTALYYGYGSLDKADNMIRLTASGQFISMGMYAMGLIISFLSIFASVGSISSEIESGTFDAILAKPISRYEIILGRLFGILLVLIIYTTILYMGVIGFNIGFGKDVITSLDFIALIKALGILYLLPIFLCSFGVFFSTRMSTMAGGITLVIFYFCAMIGGVLEQISNFIQTPSAKIILSNMGIISSLIMPSDIIYRKVSSTLFTTSSGFSLNISDMLGGKSQPSTFMMIYIFIYALFLVFLAIKKFNKRDM